MNEASSARPSLARAQEEVRLARLELERWQAATDRYCGDDPQKFHSEIRMAEQRFASGTREVGRVEPVLGSKQIRANRGARQR
jgi:hypothetical protein